MQIASPAPIAIAARARHGLLVRVTHWLNALCVLALLVSGIELVISHPRFYWGEEGHSLTPALFSLPIPASRSDLKTGYNFVLPDQNGWSRSLHFQTAWLVVFTGLIYVASILRSGHLRRDLLPQAWNWPAISRAIASHLRFEPPDRDDTGSYNVLQRIAYVSVIFGLFPLLIWTGLAMSPALTSAFPFLVDVFGGHQSARTVHFFASGVLVLFVVVHVGMVFLAGFRARVTAMITGRESAPLEQA